MGRGTRRQPPEKQEGLEVSASSPSSTATWTVLASESRVSMSPMRPCFYFDYHVLISITGRASQRVSDRVLSAITRRLNPLRCPISQSNLKLVSYSFVGIEYSLDPHVAPSHTRPYLLFLTVLSTSSV